MLLDRQKVLEMIESLKHVISDDPKNEKSVLFVSVVDGVYCFTAGNAFVSKRAKITAQQSVEDEIKARKKPGKLPEKFMVPKSALMSFGELVKRHKAVCKTLQKTDQSHLFVDVDDEQLESLGEFVHLKKPGFEYTDLSSHFEEKQEATTGTVILSVDMVDALAGFSKTKKIDVKYCPKATYYHQEETGLEAVVFPYKEDETKKEDSNEQTSIND